jgi:hypothetical protein
MTTEKRAKKAHIPSKYGDKRFVDPEAQETLRFSHSQIAG